MIGVCSAGLASTVLPAASAAATWPVKIASGKFHGEMQANDAAAVERQRVALARGAGQLHGRAEQAARLARVVAQVVDRLAHVALRALERLAGLAHDHGHEAGAVALEELGRGFEDLRARRRRPERSRRAAPRVALSMAASACAGVVMRTVPMRSRRSCGQVMRLAELPPAVVCPAMIGPASKVSSSAADISASELGAHRRLGQRQARCAHLRRQIDLARARDRRAKAPHSPHARAPPSRPDRG